MADRLRAERIKVVYVAGYERSGSTLLARVLGELPKTFNAGELRLIWQFSYIENRLCGCGQPFSDCPFWQEVTRQAFGSVGAVHPHQVLAMRERTQQLPLMLLPASGRLLAKRFTDYITVLEMLYRAVADVSDSRIIVDSSKSPTYLFVLRLMPLLDVYVVHIVRDPRGVQHSALKRMRAGHPGYRDHSVARSALSWDAKNLSHELLAMHFRNRYLRVRYEDFVADPLKTLAQVRTLLREPGLALPEVEHNTIDLARNHSMTGSPSRREFGRTTLRPDNAWTREMDSKPRSLVTRLTLPMLIRYGYPRAPADDASTQVP